MTVTGTYTESDAYLADVAERLTRASELPSLPDPMPRWQDLVDWVRTGRCPRDVITEAERRFTALYGWTTLGQMADFTLETSKFELRLYAWVPIETVGAGDHDEEDRIDVWGDTLSQWGAAPDMPERRWDWTTHTAGDWLIFDVALDPTEVMADLRHRRALLPEDGPSSPLFPVANAFLQSPLPVEPNRQASRIISARIAMARDSDRRMPKHFSPPAHVQRTRGEQLLIPGFEDAWAPSPALPLVLYNLGGGPNQGRGAGAPLALRIFVESVLAVPQEARNGNRRELEVSLREFLSWVAIGTPDALRRPNRYLDQVQRAIEALDKAWIPIYNPVTKEHRIERVVLVQGIPTGRGALEKPVRIYVTLPPGSENGPLIPPSLRHWGKRSAGAYRLLLNLCYHWFRPGVTRRPISQPGREVFWYQSQNPHDYDPITTRDLLRLAFPNSGAKNGFEMTHRALMALRDLQNAGDVRTVETQGDRMIVMPPSKPETHV